MLPNIKGNPLYISVYLLIISYFIGEFIIPKYNLLYIINLFGLVCLIISVIFFSSAFSLFKSYNENPRPNSDTSRLIKTGIFAYTRNPIYFAFVLFHLGMFMLFENVMYFICSIILFFWINNYVIKAEEEFLKKKFDEEYERYCSAVNRWVFF